MNKRTRISLSAWSAEMKRRKVYPVIAAYAVFAWVILQIGEVTFEPLGLPGWAMVSLIVLVVLGFPVVFVLSWVFDLTRTGLRRDSGPEPRHRKRLRNAVDRGSALRRHEPGEGSGVLLRRGRRGDPECVDEGPAIARRGSHVVVSLSKRRRRYSAGGRGTGRGGNPRGQRKKIRWPAAHCRAAHQSG